MGFVIMVALGLYLLISMGVVAWAVSYAKKNGKSAKRWGWGAALGMYLLVFWDWIPTVVTHQYYCATEAGFWVYKTPEQWMKENPGVMEGLVYNKAMPYTKSQNGIETVLNQRFIHIYKYEGPFLFNQWRMETQIRDYKNNETIAREVVFSSAQKRRQAGWTGWKFWLNDEDCRVESNRDHGSFDKITAQIEGDKK